jgi:alpha-1,6-mannosyltransferase
MIGELRVADVTQWYSPTSGGIRTYLHAKADYAQRAGTPHLLVVTGRKRSRSGDAAHGTVAVQGRRLYPGWGYAPALRAREFIAELEWFRPSVVVIHDAAAFPDAIARWAAERSVRVIAVCHSHLADGTRGLPQAAQTASAPLLNAVQARALRRADCVVVTSTAMRDRIATVTPAEVVVLPLGVDTDEFGRAQPNSSLKARLVGDSRLVLYAGRLSSEKGVDALAGVLARLPEDYAMVVAGSGTGARGLARRAREAGVVSRFHMMGHVDDRHQLAELFATADCFVHPNGSEPFGLAPLEALVAGCRVVVPAGIGAAGVLRANGAIVVPNSRPATLARGIERAMTLPRPRPDVDALGWRVVFDREWRLYEDLGS